MRVVFLGSTADAVAADLLVSAALGRPADLVQATEHTDRETAQSAFHPIY
jgi:hypothetical protein